MRDCVRCIVNRHLVLSAWLFWVCYRCWCIKSHDHVTFSRKQNQCETTVRLPLTLNIFRHQFSVNNSLQIKQIFNRNQCSTQVTAYIFVFIFIIWESLHFNDWYNDAFYNVNTKYHLLSSTLFAVLSHRCQCFTYTAIRMIWFLGYSHTFELALGMKIHKFN